MLLQIQNKEWPPNIDWLHEKCDLHWSHFTQNRLSYTSDTLGVETEIHKSYLFKMKIISRLTRHVEVCYTNPIPKKSGHCTNCE